MLRYMVVEFSGKQYKVFSDKPLLVDFLGDIKKFESSKVLLKAEEDKIEIGQPYLKDKVSFEVIDKSKSKIRVATYKAKANTRKVIGQKVLRSKIRLAK